MKVNIFEERVSFNNFDIVSHKNNFFTLKKRNTDNLNFGDFVTVSKTVDDIVYTYNAQVKMVDKDFLQAEYIVFNTSCDMRQHPRENVNFPATSVFSNGESISITVLDISSFGIKIKTNKEFPRIISSVHSEHEIFISLFGKNQKMKIVWRKNSGNTLYYGLQIISN